jgi:hypothetical protein
MTDDPKRQDVLNHGAEGLFASLWWLQSQLPDANISFEMPCEQELVVRRNGIPYKVRQVHGVDGYHYALGAAFPNESINYQGYRNAYESYSEAVDELVKFVLADPRQDDLTSWNEQPKHFTVEIPVSGD